MEIWGACANQQMIRHVHANKTVKRKRLWTVFFLAT